MPLDVDPIRIEGSWVRHVPAGLDPNGRPDPPPDNRWQRGDVVDALYLADSPACAWAEWYRHLAEAALPPNFALPRDLWTYRIRNLEVADLSDAARLARVGLATPLPGRRNWRQFQHVGEQLYTEGWRGLVAPSAARPRSMVLVIFLTDHAVADEVTPVRHLRIAEPPAPPTGMRT
ncbi:RES family NAD+ phosphorylase [Nocardioides terrisoli]|uniref:RES family NAD+ phosphorylase n=1 Tax=Nocardioides terrisoli TaxID=3388267 RepID=UPI00287BA3B9|nr:RES family NAD+ phosphorylase [Nocardioides marmorisolisilvae]